MRTQRNAKLREHSFLLTKEEFMSFWDNNCEYCGDKLNGIGLDRIDSSRGYEIDNVVPCCRWCNIMKLDNEVDEFIEHCRKVVTNNEKK